MAELLVGVANPMRDLLPSWGHGSFNCLTGKWNLFRTTPGILSGKWSLGFNNASLEQQKMLARMMGVLMPIPLITPLDNSGTWVSLYVVDFTRSHNFYVCSNTLAPSSVDSNKDGAEWCLAKVPVTSPWMSVIDYTGSQRVGCLHQAEFLDRVNLSIRNHENELVKLNGVRWNLSLLIEFIDRRKPTMYSKKWDMPRLAASGRQLKELIGQTTALPPEEDTPVPTAQVKQFSDVYKRWYAKQSRKTRKAITRALRSQ